jgi:prolyl 4-hydroxylase
VITAYKDGNAPALTVESDLDLSALDEALEQLLAISPPEDEVSAKYKQPRAFFSPDGRRLELLSEMANSVLFLFEGGQFIWPGVKVGHKST